MKRGAFQVDLREWRRVGSNHRQHDYESCALPLSYAARSTNALESRFSRLYDAYQEDAKPELSLLWPAWRSQNLSRRLAKGSGGSPVARPAPLLSSSRASAPAPEKPP